jgi:hypothetical protein
MDYGRNMAELTLNRTVEENCSALSFKQSPACEVARR